MAQNVNFVTTNPAQLNDRVTALQIAAQLGQANSGAVAQYTVAGAIALGGTAFLKTGTAGAFTLAQPAPGAQLNGGNDGMKMSLIAQDAFAYVVTTPALGINGASDTMTWTAAVGNNIELVAWNGVWYIVGTPRGVALTEV